MGMCNFLLKVFWKIVFGFVGIHFGILTFLLLQEFIFPVIDLNLSEGHKLMVCSSLIIFFTLGFVLSNKVTCIILLTLPEFTSRAGRRSLQATILILVLAGPLQNIGDNGEETLRFLSCIMNMLWDIFLTGVDLVLAPIQHVLDDLKRSASEQEHDDKYNASLIKNMMDPIFEEIEGTQEIEQIKVESDEMDYELGFQLRSSELERKYAVDVSPTSVTQTQVESERIVKSYQKKLAYRCKEVSNRAIQSCRQVFQGKYEECDDYFGFASTFLCWPLKLEFVCNMVTEYSLGNGCDAEKLIDDSFGESYVFAKKGIDDFTKSFKFRVNYEGLVKLTNLEQVKMHRDALLEGFLQSKKHVQWYLTLVKRILTLSYLFVLLSAMNYHKKYFSRLSFDNLYITRYFGVIEARRQSEDKSVLLPLKSFEQSELSKVWRLHLTGVESRAFANRLFSIGLQAGVVFTIFGLDHIFTELLHLLENHAEIQVKQEGVHVFAIEVKGEGFLAQLLRGIVKEFSIRKDIDMVHFTKPCLPVPRILPRSYNERVLFLFSCLLINAYLEAHFERFRHCITDFFYPKRYKQRTVWLYNEIMRRRRRRMSHLKRKVLENADKFRLYMPLNPLQLLVHWFPLRCACLSKWKVGRRKCILCLANGSVYHCAQCGFCWCEDCFNDVDQRCLVCVAEAELEERRDVTIPNGQQDDDLFAV